MNRFFLAGVGVLLLIMGSACKPKLPNTNYKAYSLVIPSLEKKDNAIVIKVTNPLACPIILVFNSSIKSIDELLDKERTKVVDAYGETQIEIPSDIALHKVEKSIKLVSFWTSLNVVNPDTSVRYDFPFLKGKSYKIIQNYKGDFSHNTDFSRFAIDFKMPVGDTICAARNGIVVGKIEENEDWIHGNHQRYRSYVNYLRLFHPEDETYTDYAHLKKDGVLVAMGDTVQAGQVVAIAGYTGLTTTPHLHFNAFKPNGKGNMIGIPIRFKTIAGKAIKKGMVLERE